MGRENGASPEQLLALAQYRTSPEFDERERIALEYAERITVTDQAYIAHLAPGMI